MYEEKVHFDVLLDRESRPVLLKVWMHVYACKYMNNSGPVFNVDHYQIL